MNYRPLAAMLTLALCALTLQAQSGRHQVKPPPAAPVPTPTPEPTPIPKKAEKESDLMFFVGVDRQDSYQTLPFSYYDAAVHGCADRLRAGSSSSVEISEKSVSRGEAIKRAKGETGVYVVYLMLTFDSMARTANDLVLEYVVFEGGTAKVATSGRSYMNGQRAGPIVVGPPRGTNTGGLYAEQRIQLAGEDAGNRIIKALHLHVEIPSKP